jgi:hypothetical protein
MGPTHVPVVPPPSRSGLADRGSRSLAAASRDRDERDPVDERAVDVLARHEQPEMDRRNEDLENLSFVDAFWKLAPGRRAGHQALALVVRIVAVDDDGQVHFTILPGSLERNHHLLDDGRT